VKPGATLAVWFVVVRGCVPATIWARLTTL
jgi:hypothetical protein